MAYNHFSSAQQHQPYPFFSESLPVSSDYSGTQLPFDLVNYTPFHHVDIGLQDPGFLASNHGGSPLPATGPQEGFVAANVERLNENSHAKAINDNGSVTNHTTKNISSSRRQSSSRRRADSNLMNDGLAMVAATAASSSDEKDPQMDKRKAQNRAAQRAFRERKEQRVRDLELELERFKKQYDTLLQENELQQREIARLRVENEIFRAVKIPNRNNTYNTSDSTSTPDVGTAFGDGRAGIPNGQSEQYFNSNHYTSANGDTRPGGYNNISKSNSAIDVSMTDRPPSPSPLPQSHSSIHSITTTPPPHFAPILHNAGEQTTYQTPNFATSHGHSHDSHLLDGSRGTVKSGDRGSNGHDHHGSREHKGSSGNGGRLLDTRETWDFVVAHLAQARVQLDVQRLFQKLKPFRRCSGTGLVIEESCVLQIIAECVEGESDELI